MDSERPPFINKVPFIGHHRKQKAENTAQDAVFTAALPDGYVDQEPTVREWLRATAPTGPGVLKYVADTFPFTQWILSYNLTWFIGDLIAGVTVGAVLVPKSMAYAKLAQIPVEYGLYSSFVGSLIYWMFGTSKDINIGPVAVASTVMGTIVADAGTKLPNLLPAEIAASLTLICGIIIIGMGLLRLGWLVDLISMPAVASFITGSAIAVSVGQIPVMLGLDKVSSRDVTYKIVIDIFKNLGHMQMDAAVGVSALAMLYLVKWFCGWASARFVSKGKVFFFISSLRTVFVILFYTLISFLVNRTHKDKPSFHLIGFIPAGLHKPALPPLNSKVMSAVAGNLPSAIIVLLIEHISIAKSFGRINNYTINPSSELTAIGATNILGPMVGAFGATGSFSSTAINSKAGARTPLAGIITAIVVLVAIYTLTPVFFFVPKSVLSSVIIHAIGDMITPPSQVYQFWRISPLDFLVFFTGIFVTIFVGIQEGIFATIALSIIVLISGIFNAHGKFLGSIKIQYVPGGNGKEPETFDSSKISDAGSGKTVYLPLDRRDGSNPRVDLERPYPGIFIYRFTDGFNYANAGNQLENMANGITEYTRTTQSKKYEKKGDIPWNMVSNKMTEEPDREFEPTLKAVILDFSSVSRIDLTSLQNLIDIRQVLDRHAAPTSVQWHFACIQSRWIKRALISAKFGYPTFNGDERLPKEWKSVFSVADSALGGEVNDTVKHSNDKTDIEMIESMQVNEQKDGISNVEQLEHVQGKNTSVRNNLYGVNRPFFHLDVDAAVKSALLFEEWKESYLEELGATT
ncbi:sulfate permease 2 [Microthyrium microscopicum]|uniref:Sulfate permease 2 n=1 Tax=Microthyrium microscopicum TaxID=703497 RepID=A0A6A6U2Q0_9PEZI|nr:sulfate permease 2 [Microthyrium microscopicum]